LEAYLDQVVDLAAAPENQNSYFSFGKISLKGLCHEDFAILGPFCAKITT